MLAAEIAQDIIGRDHKSDSESESESYYSNEFDDKIHINSHQNLIQLQRDRVADARRFVENITNNPDPIEATKRTHMTKVNSNKLKAKERDHALRQESGMYHDSETLQQKLNELQSQLTSLTHSEKTLNTRLNESTIYLTNLAEKKKKLLNNKKLSDFKVDVSLYGKTRSDRETASRTGWLEVPQSSQTDRVAMQLHSLEMSLLNKEMLKSIGKLEAHAATSKSEAAILERRLEQKKNKLEAFPVKVMQNIEDVQRDSIKLVDEKSALERERDVKKRMSGVKLSEVRSELMKTKDVVTDSSEELKADREDLRYWTSRLRTEKIRVQPVFKQVEKLKIELAREEADGWVLAVLKSAFIQGSNSDFSIDDLATNNGHNVKYDNLVDKLYIRRMPEILRTHIFPRFEKTYLLKDIIKASDEEGVFLDSEAPGDCKIVYDEFLKIVSNLRVKEKEGGGEGDEEEGKN